MGQASRTNWPQLLSQLSSTIGSTNSKSFPIATPPLVPPSQDGSQRQPAWQNAAFDIARIIGNTNRRNNQFEDGLAALRALSNRRN